MSTGTDHYTRCRTATRRRDESPAADRPPQPAGTVRRRRGPRPARSRRSNRAERHHPPRHRPAEPARQRTHADRSRRVVGRDRARRTDVDPSLSLRVAVRAPTAPQDARHAATRERIRLPDPRCLPCPVRPDSLRRHRQRLRSVTLGARHHRRSPHRRTRCPVSTCRDARPRVRRHTAVDCPQPPAETPIPRTTSPR